MITQSQAFDEARLQRVLKYPELKQDRTLQNFDWSKQPTVKTTIVNWLKLWSKFRFKGEPSPLPILHIWGANNLGKSHVAIAIGRFFALNFPSLTSTAPICTVQYVRWVNYCKSQLNGGEIAIDEAASLLILDDIDSFKPIPKSMSTYALENAIASIKSRVEAKELPIIITGNWSPTKLFDFFSTNPTGEATSETIQAAKTLSSVISRNTFAALEFTGPDLGQKVHELRQVEQDVSCFLFLEQIGMEVQF